MLEKNWKKTLSKNIDKVAGKHIADCIMDKVNKTNNSDDPEETIEWINQVISSMKTQLTTDQISDVFYGCSCRYPMGKLLQARQVFLKNECIDDVLSELQNQFESSLRDGMLFEPEVVNWILQNGMGVAGNRKGNQIFVTKVPKSGNLRKYITEEQPQAQRNLYCHCSRISDALAMGITVSEDYCLCGAGFYRFIWETILQQKVDVKIVETICSGGNVCSFRIQLPESISV